MGIVWFEELDQFAGEEEIRNVEQSLFRGGKYSFCIKSFNPPISPRNWANQWVLQPKKEGWCIILPTKLANSVAGRKIFAGCRTLATNCPRKVQT